MKTNCVICKTELDAREEMKRCQCGILYGLTPYFPYDDIFYSVNKKLKGSKELRQPKVNRATKEGVYFRG